MLREELYVDVERPAPDGRPWVVANMVATIDGAFTTGGRVGGLSNATDQRLLRLLRSVADVVLVGAGTVRAERYGPAKLDDGLRAARVARGQPPVPPIAIVSARGALDPDARVFAEADPAARPIVIVPDATGADTQARLGGVADVIVAGDTRVDPAAAVRALGERGARIVVSEGGPTLLGNLFAADVVDEFCLTITPVVGGDPGNPVARPVPAPLHEMRLAHVFADDDSHVFLRYLSA